jgi:uncharacterized membrane protein
MMKLCAQNKRFGVIAAVLLLLTVLAAACSKQPRHPAPPVLGNDVVIDTAGLPLDTPRFYTLMVGNAPVSFFVVKHHDKVVSFLDACMNCYRRKMGYGFEKDHVVCRACGTTYSIYRLDKGIGGCYPIRIAGTMKEGTYTIPLSAVEKMADKF